MERSEWYRPCAGLGSGMGAHPNVKSQYQATRRSRPGKRETRGPAPTSAVIWGGVGGCCLKPRALGSFLSFPHPSFFFLPPNTHDMGSEGPRRALPSKDLSGTQFSRQAAVRGPDWSRRDPAVKAPGEGWALCCRSSERCLPFSDQPW